MCLLVPSRGRVLPSQNVPILPCDRLPVSYCTLTGVSIPRSNDAFSLVSEFPLFQKNFSDSVEKFPDFTFSEKNQFSSAKISEEFFLVIYVPTYKISSLRFTLQSLLHTTVSSRFACSQH